MRADSTVPSNLPTLGPSVQGSAPSTRLGSSLRHSPLPEVSSHEPRPRPSKDPPPSFRMSTFDVPQLTSHRTTRREDDPPSLPARTFGSDPPPNVDRRDKPLQVQFYADRSHQMMRDRVADFQSPGDLAWDSGYDLAPPAEASLPSFSSPMLEERPHRAAAQAGEDRRRGAETAMEQLDQDWRLDNTSLE